MKPSILAALFATASTLVYSAPVELREAGRKLSASHKDSIVWISLLAKTTMSVDGEAPPQIKQALAGQEKEARSQTTGTVIDASGLIVASLYNLDMTNVVNGQNIKTPMGEFKLKASSEIKEVNIIMPDGSEIPADLVLKDEDLGLAFIKVRADSEEAEGVEFKPVDLNNNAKGDLLDDCILLGRMDESLNREASIDTQEISSLTTSPRTFYRINTDKFGSPVFLADGKLLGITIARKSKNEGNGEFRISPLVLPAADIAKILPQAKEAKPAVTANPKTDASPDSEKAE